MPLSKILAVLRSSSLNSTRPLLRSKALAGVGLSAYSFLSLIAVSYRQYQGLNPSTKRLEVVTTANQDPLLTHVPIIGVDIWEHAFYLQYLNVKADVCLCY